MDFSYRNGVLMVAGGIMILGVAALNNEPTRKTISIATMGTSLTSGESAAGGPWQQDLKAALEQSGENKFTIYNFGIGGARSRYDHDPTHSGFSVLPQVAALHADVVTIEYAMNDCVDVSVEQSAANLSQMIDTLRAARSDTRIILMTMNPTVGVLPYRDDIQV